MVLWNHFSEGSPYFIVLGVGSEKIVFTLGKL